MMDFKLTTREMFVLLSVRNNYIPIHLGVMYRKERASLMGHGLLKRAPIAEMHSFCKRYVLTDAGDKAAIEIRKNQAPFKARLQETQMEMFADGDMVEQ